jgi:apolipoprotein N-acyltransferase
MHRSIPELVQKGVTWYQVKNRWWIPLIAGIFYSICHPPFNHETHPFLFLCPWVAFVALVPLFAFATDPSRKRALRASYLYGITASLTQFYWLSNVMVEGVWVSILVGLLLLTLFIATFFLVYGLLFRYSIKKCGLWSVFFFPAFWVCIEYLRSCGDMSFPWEHIGYALTPLLPLTQLASITGVYGLSFMVVFGNIVIWNLVRTVYLKRAVTGALFLCVVFISFLAGNALWGALRLQSNKHFAQNVRISLVQNNMDQAHWEEIVSLDTALAITEQMVYSAEHDQPELMLFPESGIYCYLEKNKSAREQVFHWSDSLKIPMILGTLHFERESDNPYYKYRVFNSVFFLPRNKREFSYYHKIKLVPFSEVLPFEGIFPVISRINLGESDFHRGKEETIFNIQDTWFAAPFLCYEIIYPDFVRRRVASGANLLVNLTNDGWFGRSTASYHQAAMARMRSIENGVSLARCANSGISMCVDPVGRVLSKSKLYERKVITTDVPYSTVKTYYTAHGDWIVRVSFGMLVCAGLYIIGMSFMQRSRKV